MNVCSKYVLSKGKCKVSSMNESRNHILVLPRTNLITYYLINGSYANEYELDECPWEDGGSGIDCPNVW